MRHFDFFMGKSPTAFIIKYHASRGRKKALLQLGSHLFCVIFRPMSLHRRIFHIPQKNYFSSSIATLLLKVSLFVSMSLRDLYYNNT